MKVGRLEAAAPFFLLRLLRVGWIESFLSVTNKPGFFIRQGNHSDRHARHPIQPGLQTTCDAACGISPFPRLCLLVAHLPMQQKEVESTRCPPLLSMMHIELARFVPGM